MKDKWIFKRPYDGDDKYSSVETEDERLICLLPEPHFMPDCGDTTWYNGNVESMKAIGKLISASPDMYEALKEMLNIFDRGFPTEGSIGRTTCDEAIKAIKKAEGK